MESIRKNSMIIAIMISIAISGVFISLAMYAEEIEEQRNETKIVQDDCEHDWVVTSKYVLLRNSYKTISKCSKCGKEID